MKYFLYCVGFVVFFNTFTAFAEDAPVYSDQDLNKYKAYDQKSSPSAAKALSQEIERIRQEKENKPKQFVTEAALTPDKRAQAIDMCQTIIKVWLKTPSTARFSDVNMFRKDDFHYYISGKVDSQNSYGAMLRNSISCIMIYGDKNIWEVQSHDFF